MILFSPSQVKSYRGCVRRWALSKIAKIPQPTTSSQALGKEVEDKQLQPYLLEGRPFDMTRPSGEIAASSLAWLPEPKAPGMVLQKHFVIPSPMGKGAWGYQGFLDLWIPNGQIPGFTNGLPVVVDFKTTKSIRKWALKEDTIREDPQSQLYAVWAMLETKSKEINLDWIYMQTEGSRTALPTQVTVHSDEVAHQFLGIEKDAVEMHRILSNAPSEGGDEAKAYVLAATPPKPSACDDFGGCPYRHVCNLGPEDFFASIDKPSRPAKPEETVQVMPEIDLMSKLKAKKNAETAAETSAPVEQVPTEAMPEPEPLGINPPMEEGVPQAPPVGEAKKKGRPAGSKNKPKAEQPKAETTEVVAEQEGDAAAPTTEVAVDPVVLEFAVALEKFLKAVK